jgi:succinate dehydrogenase/fumarate reductase flavoprotein subunit
MHPDFLVVGAGVAGLRAAIEPAQAGEVLVIPNPLFNEPRSSRAYGLNAHASAMPLRCIPKFAQALTP